MNSTPPTDAIEWCIKCYGQPFGDATKTMAKAELDALLADRDKWYLSAERSARRLQEIQYQCKHGVQLFEDTLAGQESQ